MAEPKQPKQQQPSAQADVLGDDASHSGSMDGLTGEVGADGTPRDRGQGREDGDARPGADENQAGFVRDREKSDRP